MPTGARREDFSSLSIRDLLEARDAYHVHLANLENVVGTAIGKYLIREEDPDAETADDRLERPGDERRTLANSVVRKWSWPCVLVFVNDWAKPGHFATRPDQYVPPRLYLPDGRVVPTCVVYGVRAARERSSLYNLDFADGLLGGGYPVLSTVQGEDRIGSLGCLVTDGHSVYVLTNRHVAGPPGQASYTVTEGRRVRIGEAAPRSLGKVDFARAYPGWPELLRTQLNLDAGLIRVEELSEWTAQVFGVGRVGEIFDANVDTFNLDLIDEPVRAFGSASGELRGRIRALWYRYHSVGGFEYLADFLIAPRESAESVPTRPGDSGTIWFLDREAGREPEANATRRSQPIALQWGGDVLEGPGGQDRAQFALASNLATICREFELEIVVDLNVGHKEYWGKVGHYKVGAKACDVVANAKLFKLLQANVDRIGVSDSTIDSGDLPKKNDEFVALADVSDLIWRSLRRKEAPSHFADLDQEGRGAFADTTLMDLWRNDSATLTPARWKDFYDSLGIHFTRQGCLPFRVREIYEEMVLAVTARNLVRYVAAAGILAHYVADACQPLHVSHLHHGRPGHPDEERVHAVYETNMLDRFRVELVDLINDRLGSLEISSSFTGGQAAADAAMQLSHFTSEVLPPLDVIEAFNAHTGSQRTAHMWEVLRDRTTECMAEGVLYLAEMWESAWLEGGGSQIAPGSLVTQNTGAIKELYLNRRWLESTWLKDKAFTN